MNYTGKYPGAIALPVLAALSTIGLLANTQPVFAQASGTWESTGALNTPRSGHTATLLPDGQVLVTGGESSTGTILGSAELYNPATGRWTITGNMANARMNHTATLLPSGDVLVAGGIGVINPQTPCLAGAELYNPSTGQWRTTGNMTTARFWQGATLLENGQVLVAGGDICWGSGASSPGISRTLQPITRHMESNRQHAQQPHCSADATPKRRCACR